MRRVGRWLLYGNLKAVGVVADCANSRAVVLRMTLLRWAFFTRVLDKNSELLGRVNGIEARRILAFG